MYGDGDELTAPPVLFSICPFREIVRFRVLKARNFIFPFFLVEKKETETVGNVRAIYDRTLVVKTDIDPT